MNNKYLKYKTKYFKSKHKNFGGSSFIQEQAQTLLFTECGKKDISLDTIKSLLDNNPSLDPNLPNSEGYTCVILSIKSGKLEVLRYLIEEKGGKYDETIKDKRGNTCSMHACGSGHLDILKYLIGSGAEYDDTIRNNNGFTCTIIACVANKLDILRYLIEKKFLFPP